jgi:hypothetical protein
MYDELVGYLQIFFVFFVSLLAFHGHTMARYPRLRMDWRYVYNDLSLCH